MSTRTRAAAVTALSVACAMTPMACGDGDNSLFGPPAPTVLTVSFPGGPIFIGSSTPFEARETLSNATSRLAAAAVWKSDTPEVATVSAVGVVTAVAAGEATISAEVNSVVGTLRIRVLPDFGGAWRGSEVFATCGDSGAFAGLCAQSSLVGQVFLHQSSFTQNRESVSAVLDLGGGHRAAMSGTITIGGDLQLANAPVLPADGELVVQIENWRSRADIPSMMTGTYDVVLTVPGVAGSVRFGVRLNNVVRTAASASRVDGRAPMPTLRAWIRGRR